MKRLKASCCITCGRLIRFRHSNLHEFYATIGYTRVIRILEVVNNEGITLLLVIHDPELGERAHRIIRMVDGKVDQ
jgi:ABC-type ATPase involved in cell division